MSEPSLRRHRERQERAARGRRADAPPRVRLPAGAASRQAQGRDAPPSAGSRLRAALGRVPWWSIFFWVAFLALLGLQAVLVSRGLQQKQALDQEVLEAQARTEALEQHIREVEQAAPVSIEVRYLVPGRDDIVEHVPYGAPVILHDPVELEGYTDRWIVSGRGVLHLSVLIETMRREGYELQVGQPQVIYKEIDGVKCEPIEELTINVPEEFASKMIDMVTRRKGEVTSMETQGDRTNIAFDIPSRGIIGLRTNVLTASQGEAIMAHRYKEYQPYKGDISRRVNGSMVAMETGTAFAYSIDKLQDRGKFFIDPGEEVYAGQVVGEHVHDNDLVINVTKAKQLTNVRASGSDEKARIIPKVVMSLEECLEYIKGDELVEVTPKSMRMRKVILDHTERKRDKKEQ